MSRDQDEELPDSIGARLLRAHAERLRALLGLAERIGAGDDARLKQGVAALVDQIAESLVHLYGLSESGLLSRSDHLIALPALERLRNSLRFWQHRRRALRDTLHRAIETIGDAPR